MPILTGHARLAGIIGWPVAHSRSPRLHGFWLERHAIDGAYVPLADPPGALRHGRPRPGGSRFRRRQRHHPAQARRLRLVRHAWTPARERAGAVNTLVFRDGKIDGSNTDGWGFLANLRAHGVDPDAGPALILGAGGAARAVAAALLATGIPVTIANRTPRHAEALARDLPALRVVALGAAATRRSPTMRYWSTRRRSACRATRRWNST